MRWINHPSKDAAANYKPVQLAAAARCGLDVPRSVITSDPEHARMFMGDDTAVYKGLGGGVLGPGESVSSFLSRSSQRTRWTTG